MGEPQHQPRMIWGLEEGTGHLLHYCKAAVMNLEFLKPVMQLGEASIHQKGFLFLGFVHSL
jgi:hypothetical protein